MQLPLINPDPWAEIREMLIAANPKMDLNSAKPFRIVAGTGRNTRLFLVGNAVLGLAGKVYIEYDRLNPAAIFSKFGDLTKHRPIRLNGLPGTAMKISDILTQINALLGVNLKMDGDYRDIVDGGFTLPAKNAVITLDIIPYVSPTGELPLNLRIAPNTKLSLNLMNGGSQIKLADKGLNPFVKADKTLNWTLAPRQISDLSMSRDLALYNLDFSDLFGSNGLLTNCCEPTPVTLQGYYQFGYRFRPDVLGAINAKLERVGITPLTPNRVHFVYTYATPNIQLTGDHVYGQGRTWAYTSSYMVSTPGGSVASRVPPRHINKKFSRVFKVLPNGWPAGLAYDDSSPSFDTLPESQRLLYLHYDPL